MPDRVAVTRLREALAGVPRVDPAEDSLQELLDMYGYDDWYVVTTTLLEAPDGELCCRRGTTITGLRSPLVSLGLV